MTVKRNISVFNEYTYFITMAFILWTLFKFTVKALC